MKAIHNQIKIADLKTKAEDELFGEKHLVSYDILRGLLIIFVVIGHGLSSGFAQMIIYWFHMPCFVILSGWLYKAEKIDFPYILRKAKRLLIPFIIYAFATDILFYRNSVFDALTMIALGAGRFRGGVVVFTLLFYYFDCFRIYIRKI